MKQHGTYLVPTMLIGQAALDIAKTHPEQLNPSSAKRRSRPCRACRRTCTTPTPDGVKIAFGTDQGLVAHGLNAREFALMVKAGMKPMDAIIAATGSAADLIGDTADIGSVRTGRYADIVAVNWRSAEGRHAARTRRLRDEGRRDLQGRRQDRAALTYEPRHGRC